MRVWLNKKKQERENVKNKLKGANSRVHILENELKNQKVEHENFRSLLINKSENDNSLISVLKQEMRKLKRDLEKNNQECQFQFDKKENCDNVNFLIEENEKIKKEIEDIKKEVLEKKVGQNLNGSSRSGFGKNNHTFSQLKEELVPKLTALELKVKELEAENDFLMKLKNKSSKV